ncbi:MAG: hypothetical protein WD396_05800 [Pseudohongiellaceae bacterium]
MSRWTALAIHLGISVVALLALLAVILAFWYPGILFRIDGGWSGLRIVIGVDLVLGPLLTLVVFKAGKPGLRFDLACIALFQATCMAAGMWIVYTERPIALVLAYDTLYSLDADAFTQFDRDPGLLDAFPGSYPKLLYTELPEDDIQADIVAIRSQFMDDPLYMQTDRYRAMPRDDMAVVFRREESLRTQFEEQRGESLPTSCLFSRFTSVVTTGFVCLDPQNRRITEFFTEETAERDDGPMSATTNAASDQQ